jgi:FkbM family methyltransferase
MRCPESDPGFWDHPVHGFNAQQELINRVVRCCGRKRGIAVDAGAHIGIWSISLALHGFDVHAFEPVQDNFDCLRWNAKDLNVQAYPYGLADQEPLYARFDKKPLDNSGMWRLTEMPSGVPLVRLDSQGLCDVDLIKLDVEGFEGRVLLGARKTIERDQPVIVFEDNGLGRKYFGSDWIDPKKVLLGLGYIQQARVRKDEIWLPA